MLKRILTLSLCLLMLVSLCPSVSVFAADTKPAAIVEDFEDGEVNSAIVDLTAGKTVTRTVVDGVGRNGGKALKITNLMDTAGIGFNVTYSYAANVSVLTYDIQVSKAPTTGGRVNHMVVGGSQSSGGAALLKLFRDGNGDSAFSFTNQNGKNTNGVTYHDVEVGKWYTIVMVRYYNKAEVWVIDENGNIVANNSRTSHANSQAGYLLLMGTDKILDDGEILIDNVEFNLYSRDFGPSLLSDTLVQKTDVPLDTDSITVTFDQPLDNLSATLTPDGGSAITCTMEVKKDANEKAIPLTYVVTLPALTSNKKYTLDFTGSYTKQGTSSREIHVDSNGKFDFTTLDNSKTHLWDKIYDISVAPNGSKTDITFKLADNPEYANITFKGAIMAVLYTVTKDETGNVTSREMTAFDIVSRAEDNPFAVNGGKDENGVETNTESFSLGTLPANGYEIWLIQMDTASGLTPLAFGKYPVE